MSEIKNNEKNIDNPPVKEEIKKPEDHKKQEDMGNNLDRMRSTGGASLEAKTAQSRILETPKQKEIKENKAKNVDVQDKKTTIGSKLENLSSAGTVKEKEHSEKNRLEKADGVKEITKPYYEDAKELAQKSEVGSCFTDHTEAHVEQVEKKSREAANALEKAIQNGKFQKESDDPDHIQFVGDVDKDVLSAAALSHDTGMRGDGYAVRTYKENGEIQFVKDADGKIIVDEVDNKDFDQVRSNHSLNSAINILADREKYKELGYTDEQVDMMAAECMAHSKSSSGVQNLNSRKDWEKCFDCIDSAWDQYKKDHPGDYVDFDRTRFENDDKKLGQLATATLALRVGDVSRDSGPEAKSQSGEEIHVNRETINDAGGSIKNEVGSAEVTKGNPHKKLDLPEDKLTKAKQVHIGEQNITENHTICKEDGTVVHEIRVNDGTSAPACTAEAISDHIGEFESAKGAEFTIEVTFDKPCASDKEKQAYEDLRDKVEAKPDNNITIIYPWDKED